MPYLLREFLHGECRLHDGGMLSFLELRGQLDPQPLKPQLRVPELGTDAEDLAGHPKGIANVVRPVECPAPMHQDGGERPLVSSATGHGHRPVAEPQSLRVRTHIMQPVGQAGQDRGSGRAVLLAQPLERLLQERFSPLVRTNRRREDAAVPERRPQEQIAVPEAAGGVRRLGESLVSGGVLPGPVVRTRQLKEQLAPERLIPRPEAIEQLERLPEVTHRDLGRHLSQRTRPGQALISNRLLGGANARGRAEVVRELGRRDPETGFQRFTDPLVQPGPAAPAQPVGGYSSRQ